MNRDVCEHFEPVELCEECGVREIVAGMIDGHLLTNNSTKLREAVEYGRRVEWQDRAKMQFMASCDVGEKWRDLANGPTLFRLTRKGVPLQPNS